MAPKSEVLSELPAKQRQMVILDPGAVKSKTKEMKASTECKSSVGRILYIVLYLFLQIVTFQRFALND